MKIFTLRVAKTVCGCCGLLGRVVFLNIKIAVFILPQDALDVRYLNQLTDNKNDHEAFVPVFQYKKGAILFLS